MLLIKDYQILLAIFALMFCLATGFLINTEVNLKDLKRQVQVNEPIKIQKLIYKCEQVAL